MKAAGLALVPAFLLLLATARPAFAADGDVLEFFREEARVVTAARRPQPAGRAPATVYVVTAADIKASGARTLWDALRAVPGVDVIESRAGQGEVSIRGLDKPFSNRTLVLVDGRTVLNGYFDFVVWESIPVTLDEVERIEVVEGPASALYGPNAVNGVINIITKTPDEARGGLVRHGAGERATDDWSFLYGGRSGRAAYRLGGGYDRLRRFEDASQTASEAAKVDGLASYDLPGDARASVSGGITEDHTQVSAGVNGPVTANGPTAFLRGDLEGRDARLRVFWNHARPEADGLVALAEPVLQYDTYDADLERAFRLPFANDLTLGGGYRRDTARSTVFSPGLLTQDLWSLSAEDEWRPLERWTVAASARLDRHPFTPLMFSPRGSVVYAPRPGQVFRASAGESFRDPTLLEDYLSLVKTVANPGTTLRNPPFTSLQVTALGQRGLSPERMTMEELAHEGTFGRVKTTLTLFHYRLRDVITPTPFTATCTAGCVPTGHVVTTFANQGETRAWGGEAGVEGRLAEGLSLFGNYSYQSLTDDGSHQAVSSPRHKANAGVRARRGRLTGSLWGDWVGTTWWNKEPAGATFYDFAKVPDYWLLNLGASYAFPAPWEGLEASVSAFNLLDRAHYELLPSQGPNLPGQAGEVVRARWAGSLTYKF